MGDMKFEMPNDYGIYLHDTPHKELFAQDERHLSNGCVRLSDYRRFADWVFGRDAAGDLVARAGIPAAAAGAGVHDLPHGRAEPQRRGVPARRLRLGFAGDAADVRIDCMIVRSALLT